MVQADLDILKNLAQLAERRLPFLAPYKPLSLAREFERSLKRELDFTIERRTMQRCQGQFADDPTAHIPFTVDAFSTSRVIAMEFIDGVGVDDLEGIRATGHRPGRRGHHRGAGSCSSRSSTSASSTPIPTPATSASCPAAWSPRSTTACSASSTPGPASGSPTC